MPGTPSAAASPSPSVLRLVEGFRSHVDDVAARTVAAMVAEIPSYVDAPPAMLDGARMHVRGHFEALLSSLERGEPATADDLLFVRPFVTKRAYDGIPMADFMQAFRIGLREIWLTMHAQVEDDESREAALSVVAPIIHYINVAAFQAAQVYTEVLQLLHARGERVRRDLLADLIDGRLPQPGPRREAAREAGLEAHVELVVVSATTRVAVDDELTLRSAAAALARACGGAKPPLTVVRRDEIVVLAPLVGGRTVEALCAALVVAQEKLVADGVRLAVGVSTVQAGLERVLHGYRDASEASERLGADGGVLALPMLSAFDYLSVIGSTAAERLIPAPIQRFVEEDAAEGGTLAQTVLAYVAADLNITAAAEQLFVHTNTARYRLAKVAERTGCDLRRVDDLIEVLLAIKIGPRTRGGSSR